MRENQAEFKGWARVEVMGHQTHIGYVTTEAYGQAVMFRIDRPEIPESEETLSRSQFVGSQVCPAGTVVKRGKIEGVSVLVGAGSIYRIIPCSEDAAMQAIREGERRPLLEVKLPDGRAIEAPKEEADEDGNSEEFDDSEDDVEEEIRAGRF